MYVTKHKVMKFRDSLCVLTQVADTLINTSTLQSAKISETEVHAVTISDAVKTEISLRAAVGP